MSLAHSQLDIGHEEHMTEFIRSKSWSRYRQPHDCLDLNVDMSLSQPQATE